MQPFTFTGTALVRSLRGKDEDMRIKSLHPSDGWRAVYPNRGNTRIAQVVFFAMLEEDVGCVVPLVVDDHDFGTELVVAEHLGHYALLGPGEVVDPDWVEQLAERSTR